MNFRRVLSRDAANVLVVLTGQLKQKGISVDLKALDSMDSLLQMARVFNEPELNDLANRLQGAVAAVEAPVVRGRQPIPVVPEMRAKTIMYRGQKVENEPSVSVVEIPVSPPPKKRTKTIVYRGQKVEVEV